MNRPILMALFVVLSWSMHPHRTHSQNDALVITAQDEMIVDKKDNVGWALGAPEAHHKDRSLKGDRLKVLFQPDTHHVSHVEALGHMHLTSPTQSLQGDIGRYDVNTQYAWCNGAPATLKDPVYMLTTYGVLQVWDQHKYGVASGESLLEMKHHRLWGDMMTIQQSQPTHPSDQPYIAHAEALGHILAISDDAPADALAHSPAGDAQPSSVLQGNRASYQGRSQEVRVTGDVSCQKGDHFLQGAKALVDQVHHTTTVWAQDPDSPAPFSQNHGLGALLYPQASSSQTSERPQ